MIKSTLRKSRRFGEACKRIPRLIGRVLRRIKVGVREQDVAAELEFQMRMLGAEKARIRNHRRGGRTVRAAACAANRASAGGK